jgi:hypothetical protein
MRARYRLPPLMSQHAPQAAPQSTPNAEVSNPPVASGDGGYPRRMTCAGTCRLGLMAAWGLPPAIPLDIAARRDNTPVACHSNTNKPMEGAGQQPVLRVAHRLGWMAR